jgi:pimeloyl-ACP methyl ester carboxylesterase
MLTTLVLGGIAVDLALESQEVGALALSAKAIDRKVGRSADYDRLKEHAQTATAPDGVDVHYWATPGRDKSTVVLHPGSSMTHSSLQKLEAGLQERGHPTLVFDPRGFGYSEAPADPEAFTLANYSGDLERVLNKAGVEDPILLSHSFGFMPVADYAARTGNATRVTGICGSHNHEDTAPSKILFHIFDKGIRYVLEWTGTVYTGLEHLKDGSSRGYPDQSEMVGEGDPEILRTIVDQPFEVIRANNVSGRVINTWNVAEQVGQLEVPVHMIYAGKDQMISPVKGEAHIRKLVDGDRLKVDVIAGAPHSVPVTDPAAVLEVLDQYAA